MTGARGARSPGHTVAKRRRQDGAALLVMLTLLVLWGSYLLVGQLNSTQYQALRARDAAPALAEAKQALIGDAISTASIGDAGYLHLPDLGENTSGEASEGGAASVLTGNAKDISVLGKFPWKTVASSPLRDQYKECLWYVVAGRFKTIPKTNALNWDTPGQIDVIDGKGDLVAANLAALLVAPGPALDGQDRSLADPAYSQCGGNYDARNYLDAFDSAQAIAGALNYFAGSTNKRFAPDSGTKRFVLADSEHYNDRFVHITVDDIFNPLIRRTDFSDAISNLLGNPDFQTIPVSGGKGTDKLKCNGDEFCENWREMLLLTELSDPTPMKIDDAMSGTCRRVVLFAGRQAAGQKRDSADDKANPLNYLENANATSFAVPKAQADSFSGTAVFNWRTPSADVVRCLP